MSVSRFSMTTAEDAEERRFQLSTFPRAVTRLKCFRKIAVLESRMSLTRLPRGQPSLAPPIIWTNVPGTTATNQVQLPIGSGASFFRLTQ